MAEPVILYPDPRFVGKSFVQLALVAIVTAVPIVLLGYFIALDEGGREIARTVAWWLIAANAVWVAVGALLIVPYYRSLRYEVQDDEMVVKAGIITRSVKHVPYRTVTNIEVKRGPFDRMLGMGTVRIQTAGMSGQTGAEEQLVGLASYNEVYETVAATLRRFRGALAPTQAVNEPEPDLAAILSEVRAIREILSRG